VLGFALTITEVAFDGYEVIAHGRSLINVLQVKEKDEVLHTRALSIGPQRSRVPRALTVRHIGVPIWSRSLAPATTPAVTLGDWPGAAAWAALQQPEQPIPDGWICTIALTVLWGFGGLICARRFLDRAV
jgi:hypothetical protein